MLWRIRFLISQINTEVGGDDADGEYSRGVLPNVQNEDLGSRSEAVPSYWGERECQYMYVRNPSPPGMLWKDSNETFEKLTFYETNP